MRTQVFVKPGDMVEHELPFSEVCMYMGVAGKKMNCQLLLNGMVQLYTLSGDKFSFPITAGEAGFYNSNDEKGWYTYDS